MPAFCTKSLEGGRGQQAPVIGCGGQPGGKGGWGEVEGRPCEESPVGAEDGRAC